MVQIKPIKVRIVNGMTIRNKTDVSFGLGGNHYAYRYIPTNEIWIEKIINPKERKFIIAHEMIERHMMRNYRYPYSRAHNLANKLEARFRKHPKGLRKKLSNVIQ
jgi:hypothetical protein